VALATDPTVVSSTLALLAAFLYGLSVHLVRRGLAHTDARAGVMISTGATAATFALLAPLWFNLEHATHPGLLIFAAFGLLHPLVSRYMAFEANRRVGATISATFESASPLLSVAVAVVLLRERPDAILVLGTLVAVGGGVYIYWHPAVAHTLMRSAVLLAMGAMTLRAMNNIVGRVGLEYVPNPMMAAFVTFMVSWLGAMLSYRVRPATAAWNRAGTGWFIAVGIVTAAASGCLYGALFFGEVVVVAPILAAYPFFVLVLGWGLRMERLTPRNLVGVVFVVLGVVAVSVQSLRSV
jgi:drug/metabolite transporter, DME family